MAATSSSLTMERFAVAIFNLTASFGSRSGGASAVAKYEYIAREGKYHHGVDEVRDVESGNMPEWAVDRPRDYWAAADAHERANGRLYREVHIAMPAELDRDQQKALARRFVEDVTGRERLPYTLAIHEGKPRESGEPANPHAHLIWSDRGHDGIERTPSTWFKRYNGKAPERGGARKSRAGNDRDWLAGVREQWAGRANEALERAGHEARVDHRSLAVRAVEAADAGDVEKAAELGREPNVHLGPAAAASLRRMTQGQPPPQKVVEALQVEDRNGMWDRVKAEIRRLKQELVVLARELKSLQRKLIFARFEAERVRRPGTLARGDPELGGWVYVDYAGRRRFSEKPPRAVDFEPPPPQPRPQQLGPDRGRGRDSGPSR